MKEGTCSVIVFIFSSNELKCLNKMFYCSFGLCVCACVVMLWMYWKIHQSVLIHFNIHDDQRKVTHIMCYFWFSWPIQCNIIFECCVCAMYAWVYHNIILSFRIEPGIKQKKIKHIPKKERETTKKWQQKVNRHNK